MIRWNTNKDGGWEAYTEMTANNTILLDIANNPNDDPDSIMKNIDKELTNIKFKSFGKAKKKSKFSISKEMDALQKEKDDIYRKNGNNTSVHDKIKDIDEKITANLLKVQREAFEQELDSICKMKITKGLSAAVFKLKENIVGSKKANQVATIVFDPKANVEVTTPEDISLEYCVNLLTNRKPKKDFEEDILLKDIVHLVRMEEDISDDIDELTIDRFKKTYETLKKRKGTKYQFIMKGGAAMKAALYKLCQTVWVSEKLPESWDKSTLIQLFKGKGLSSVLDNVITCISKMNSRSTLVT